MGSVLASCLEFSRNRGQSVPLRKWSVPHQTKVCKMMTFLPKALVRKIFFFLPRERSGRRQKITCRLILVWKYSSILLKLRNVLERLATFILNVFLISESVKKGGLILKLFYDQNTNQWTRLPLKPKLKYLCSFASHVVFFFYKLYS